MTIQQQQQALQYLEEFSERNPSAIQIVIEILNENGVFTDVNHNSFDIKVAEYWSVECTEYMRELGYKGSNLNAFPKYYDKNTPGSIDYSSFSDFFYVLYNSEVWGGDEAEKKLDSEMHEWMESYLSRED